MPPEALTRQKIDAQLSQAGWVIQDRRQINLYGGRGVAVRGFGKNLPVLLEQMNSALG